MAAAPFAIPADVAAIWRALTDDENMVAAGLIDQASTKLRARVPGVDDLVEHDPLKAELAKAAVANAVKRVLMNPTGLRSTSFMIDDYQRQDTIDQTISTGGLYIDDADLVGLARSGGKFGTIKLRAAL